MMDISRSLWAWGSHILSEKVLLFILSLLSLFFRFDFSDQLLILSVSFQERVKARSHLSSIMRSVLERHTQLHYYQGYHDIAVVVLLMCGSSLSDGDAIKGALMPEVLPIAFSLLEKISLQHLRYPFNTFLFPFSPLLFSLFCFRRLLVFNSLDAKRFVWKKTWILWSIS